ncbi:MAG: hypothetical protein EAX96_21215 [Candidatus Lokiarchaeota archaeon]|nr:hypothetical protein [Candidatus Lokiarchaeota archaeon]
MFYIEDAPTGTTKCDWCKEVIKKGTIRLKFAPSKGYNYYWHQECGKKYLEGLIIMLQKGEKGLIGREEAEKARKDAG